MLYKVVLTFKSADETLVCDHSNESCWAALSCGTVHYVVQSGSNSWECGCKKAFNHSDESLSAVKCFFVLCSLKCVFSFSNGQLWDWKVNLLPKKGISTSISVLKYFFSFSCTHSSRNCQLWASNTLCRYVVRIKDFWRWIIFTEFLIRCHILICFVAEIDNFVYLCSFPGRLAL